MASITAPAGSTVSPPLQASFNERRSELRMRQTALAIIVTGIAVAVLLSATGVLPVAVLSAAKISLIVLPVLYAAAVIIVSQINKRSDLAQDDSSNYTRRVIGAPWKSCVIYPVIEEITHRSLLQGALQWGLKRVLPAAAITVFGAQIPLYACAAIVVGSGIFGAMHAANDHNLSHVQAAIVGIQSLCLYSPLYYHYGLWASCLAHIMNNTLALTMQVAKDTILLRADERNQPMLEAPS
jgi:membrane protease YdiL (CAAX protease family)